MMILQPILRVIKKRDFITLENLYYVSFALYFASYLVGYTTVGAYVPQCAINVIDLFCLFLLFSKFRTQQLSRKRILIALTLVVIGFCSWMVTRDRNLLILFAFAVAGEGVQIRKLARIVFWMEIVCIVLISGLASIGLIDSVTQFREGYGLRTSLGFSSVNRFGLNFLALCCALVMMRWPKYRGMDFAFCIICAVIVEVVSDSRTSVFLIIVLPFIALALTLPKSNFKKKVTIAALAAVICMLGFFSIFVIQNYNAADPFYAFLNTLMTGRLQIIHHYYASYPVTLFGYNTIAINQDLFGMQGVVMDNAYAKLLLMGGIIPSIAFFYLYFSIFIHHLRHAQLDVCLLGLFVYALVGVSEWQMYHFAMNYCLVGFSYYLFATDESSTSTLRSDSVAGDM